ncbi:hypothetical protein [Halorarum halophilum]|nr:hypothetical protein [Halobaculum halophilum]
MSETRVSHDEDANLSVLDGRPVAVFGYGNQGRWRALNADRRIR